jgi:hypothetical protein
MAHTELDHQLEELQDSITQMQQNNLTEETQALDFDCQNHTDPDWWRMQDAELEAEELQEIERQAEIHEYRLNGYS